MFPLTPAEPRRVALRAPFVLLVILVCAAMATAVSWCLQSMKSQQRREVASKLTTVLSSTRAGLEIWRRDLEANASIWAERGDIRDAVRRQLLVPREASALRASRAAAELKLESIVVRNRFLGVDVLAPDGVAVASTTEAALGTKALAEIDPRPFAGALAGKVVLGLPFEQPGPYGHHPALTLAAPVRDDAGGVVAVIAFRVDPGRGLTEMTQLGRIGETGETYAFDREGRAITESRFDPQLRAIGLIGPGEGGILAIALRDPGGNLVDGHQPRLPRSEQPLTRMAQAAIAGHTGVDVEGYRDYRGVPVVGAWTWSDELGFGLATEMDRREAYALVTSTRDLALSIFGAAVIGALCLAFLLNAAARRLAASVSSERAARTEAERRLLRLQQAEADLDAAIRAREEFLRNASHELRTPMTSLSLLYQRLVRGVLGKETSTLRPDEMERFLRTSERQFSRLNQLIDNLLDAAKETRGKVALNLEEMDLAEVVRGAAERVQAQIAASGSRLELDLDAPVTGCWDRLRLSHVVCNLLGNAARHGLGNPIRVELRAGAEVARLRVEDHGVGISERDLPRVFDRFNHVGPVRNASGLGVGLYIARAIVEAHEGTISVESCLGRGTTFTVELPRPVPLHGEPVCTPDEDGQAPPLSPRPGEARA